MNMQSPPSEILPPGDMGTLLLPEPFGRLPSGEEPESYLKHNTLRRVQLIIRNSYIFVIPSCTLCSDYHLFSSLVRGIPHPKSQDGQTYTSPDTKQMKLAAIISHI